MIPNGSACYGPPPARAPCPLNSPDADEPGRRAGAGGGQHLACVAGGCQCALVHFGRQVLGVVQRGIDAGQGELPLGGGEPAGDGLAGDLAGPFGVRAVQPGRVGVAAAAGLAAGVGADGQGAGQGGAARGGDPGGDLVQGRALGAVIGLAADGGVRRRASSPITPGRLTQLSSGGGCGVADR